MKKILQCVTLLPALLLGACAGEDNTPDTPAAINYTFTVEELTGLVMVTQGYLDGHLPETGQLKEGATLLVFEENFAWAFGKTSPERLHSKHTKFSWKLNPRGQVILKSIPDDPNFAPSPSTCTLTKINVHSREYTQEGLAEKIDTAFKCDDYPNGQQDLQTFLLPLPLFPHMLAGTQTYFSSKPDAISTFRQDRTLKRPDPIHPGEDKFLYDPYESGKYHHSITITRTDIERSDAGETTREVGKHRLFMFGHGAIKHSTLLNLSYSPIIYTPSGDDGYTNQFVDRYELHSVYRAKNLVYNPMMGKNYPDRPNHIARSVNANLPPLNSALTFND